MWDAIRKAAGDMMERGAAFLRHSAALNRILGAATSDEALCALRAHVFSIESAAEFQRFKGTIVQQMALTRLALQQAQTNATNSWGGSTEDRIAYLYAHVRAGEPAVSGETQAVQIRLNGLIAIQELVDPIWAEAEQARVGQMDAELAGDEGLRPRSA